MSMDKLDKNGQIWKSNEILDSEYYIFLYLKKYIYILYLRYFFLVQALQFARIG